MLLALAALTAVAVAGGCGGSDDSGSGTGTSVPGSASVEESTGANGGKSGREDGKSGGRESGADGEGADGGSEKSGSSAAEPSAGESIGKAEFVEQASEICTRRVTEILGKVRLYVSQKAGGGKRVRELQAESVDTVFVPGIEAEIGELKELEAPAGDEAEVEAFVQAMEDGIELTQKKSYGASNIEDLGREYERASKLARRYGIVNCSIGG